MPESAEPHYPAARGRRAALDGSETSSGIFAEACVPGLSCYLDRIRGVGEWRGITQVEVIQLLHLHAVVEGSGKSIYTFRDFGILVAQKLCAKQAARYAVSSDA